MTTPAIIKPDEDELRETAREIAQDAYQGECWAAQARTRRDLWGNHPDYEDFDAFFDADEDYWLARAAESYLPGRVGL